ncbi:hypothetical protein H7J86_21040 [Mycobacterium hackensackense]|uniref:hypothetical protein n=1 Tax=Mycobacterium hackensackense TaxID=228909 RepID=UPI002265AAFC|nr:hypothetical protein [Mycobacterium hackensackense]MCV7254650.1 hypothetical protein [Mycobacterium hackensackense]
MADWWARAFGLIGIAISLAGLVLNVIKYRHDRPRLGITAKVATVYGLGEDRSGVAAGIVATITNDGGADIRINRVSVSGGQLSGSLLTGPTTPLDLTARGGSSTWVFDYSGMSQQLGELIRTEMHSTDPVKVQVVVRSGSRDLTPKHAYVYVNPPGDSTYRPEHVTFGRRYRDWRRTWSKPVPMLDPYVKFTAADFEARQSLLTISNRFRRRAAPSELVLTVKHSDDSREIVSSHPAINVPAVPGHKSVEVAVPFIDDANKPAAATYEWVLRTHRGFGGQAGRATLLSEVPHLGEQLRQLPDATLDRRDP